jgi:hypothetical protein
MPVSSKQSKEKIFDRRLGKVYDYIICGHGPGNDTPGGTVMLTNKIGPGLFVGIDNLGEPVEIYSCQLRRSEVQ